MIGPIAGWRNYKEMYALYGSQCTACKKLYYPKKYLCSCGAPAGGGQSFTSYKFSGKGTIVTFTQIMHTTESFAQAVPYCIGIIRLEEKVRLNEVRLNEVRLLAQITDASLADLRIGMPVQAVFRKISEEGDAGIITYGTMFAPI